MKLSPPRAGRRVRWGVGELLDLSSLQRQIETRRSDTRREWAFQGDCRPNAPAALSQKHTVAIGMMPSPRGSRETVKMQTPAAGDLEAAEQLELLAGQGGDAVSPRTRVAMMQMRRANSTTQVQSLPPPPPPPPAALLPPVVLWHSLIASYIPHPIPRSPPSIPPNCSNCFGAIRRHSPSSAHISRAGS